MPCRWLYRLMVRVPWLLFWPLVCASLHRKCAQHRNVRRVILLHRLLAGYFGVSMGAPPSPLAGCPGTVGVIWSHLPPPYHNTPLALQFFKRCSNKKHNRVTMREDARHRDPIFLYVINQNSYTLTSQCMRVI